MKRLLYLHKQSFKLKFVFSLTFALTADERKRIVFATIVDGARRARTRKMEPFKTREGRSREIPVSGCSTGRQRRPDSAVTGKPRRSKQLIGPCIAEAKHFSCEIRVRYKVNSLKILTMKKFVRKPWMAKTARSSDLKSATSKTITGMAKPHFLNNITHICRLEHKRCGLPNQN